MKKKKVSIFYHKYRKSVAIGVDRIAKEGTANNLADLFIKILVHIRRENMLDKFTYLFI